MANEQVTDTTQMVKKVAVDAKNFWTQLPKPMRAMLVIVGALAIGGGVALAVLDQTDYKVLFSELSPSDATAIIDHLKGSHVEYKIESGGGTILVPSQNVHDMRLELAGMGIPAGGGVGFELFDEQRFGMTEFEEQVALGRALEGELARTISKIKVIKNTKVHLVLAKKSLLGSNSSPAQASVIIELRRGREISKETIQSIVHLVSSSVDSLSPDNITVVDTRGKLLSTEGIAGSGGGGGLEYQRNLEQDLEGRLSQMLNQLIGPGASVVQVAADVDFSNREITEEHYDPEKTAVRSERREVETSGSQSKSASGIPGTRSNLPGGETPGSGGTAANSKREMETKNYEIDKVVSKTISPGAKIKKLSVAVVVNGINAEGEKFKPRSAANLRKIESAVRGAIGYDKDRGDSITVQSIAFHIPEPTQMEEPSMPLPWKEYLPLAVGGLVVLFLLLGFFGLMRKTKGSTQTAMVPAQMMPSLPRPVSELEGMMQQEAPVMGAGNTQPSLPGPPGVPNAPGAVPSLSAAANNNQSAEMIHEVRRVFLEESENASRVLKSWLADAKSSEPQESAKGS